MPIGGVQVLLSLYFHWGPPPRLKCSWIVDVQVAVGIFTSPTAYLVRILLLVLLGFVDGACLHSVF